MRNTTCLLFILVSLTITLKNVHAQGPPIFTDSPYLLGLDGGGIRTFGKYISTGNGQTYSQPLIVPYNVTTNYQIGGVQPFIIQFPDNGSSKSGFGNFTLFGKYSVIQIDGKAKTFRALMKFSQTFSTGASNISVDTNVSQLEFVIGYITTKYGIYGTVGYTFVSNDFPDNLIYNFAFGYPLLPQKYPPFQLNLFIELNGTHTLDIENNLLFVSSGIQIITSSIFLIESGVQIPVVDDRSATKFTYAIGMRYLIF
ncbi:MAG: hypothetical protein HND52_17570 [Ignavibacteriae bacterium]|nr:hypothetical protein [Ignavibacteriota bacterium]NOG99773.1 hypothetical protein [Ignavibacteriota bacterium]